MANPIIKKRTIEHPGFEFFETDMSIYREYTQDTSALAVGFFSQGPILIPEQIKNLNDYTVYFGTPKTEAEVYTFKGIEAVLNAGGTVTAIRLPYANSTATVTESDTSANYKVVIGNFKDATAPADIVNAYESTGASEVTFANDSAFTIDPATGAISTNSRPSVSNAGVSFKNIELSSDIKDQEYISSVVGGVSEDDFVIINKYNNTITQRGEEIFVTVLGVGNAIREQGLSADSVTARVTTPSKKISKKTVNGKVVYALVDVEANDAEAEFTELNTFELTEDADAINVLYHGEKVEGAIAKSAELKGALYAKDEMSWETTGDIKTDGSMQTVAEVYHDSLASWFPVIPTYDKEINDELKTFIDKRKDDTITVVVSKVTPSKLEAGKFTFTTLETFSGSIFKGSVDQISQESNYIGDIINESSNFISFYGKTSYNGYTKDSNAILVENQLPLRMSWVEGAVPNAKIAGNDITESGTAVDLTPALYKVGDITDYARDVLRKALNKVRNSVTYLYRDVYDFGTSSVIAYATGNEKAIYNPAVTNMTEKADTGFINSKIWKKVVLEFARHCQYAHKLSMFHADSPRKLVLNGNLSRCDDLYQDQDKVVFTPKKIAAISIKNNTYIDQNAQWWETSDEFNKTTIWIPNSIRLASAITHNDIYSQVWDAPAGHHYAPVSDVVRPAFNPEIDIMDRLYTNCINYGVVWSDGAKTIEGQKTAYSEISTLNRINARRLLIWLERYTQTVASNYIYEPNTSDLRNAFVQDLETEFKRCRVQGGLSGFRIVCDETNNPGEVIDRNELRVAIMVQITKTVEFVLANFIITKTGVNLEEVSPVF